MASHRCTRNEAAANEDKMESFIAMARAVREQVAATTLMPSKSLTKIVTTTDIAIEMTT